MKTVWEYSLETEAKRVLHCAHQMAVGFYRVNNFEVLPLGHPLINSSVVTLPDINCNSIPRFWEKVKKVDVNVLPIQADKKLIEETQKLLEKANLPSAKYESTKKIWDKASPEILVEIQRLIPDVKGKIRKIIIFPTTLGTSSSFNLVKKFPADIYIYLREDQDIWTITEAILTAITRKIVYQKLEGLWSESELLVDWLVSYSSLSEILNKYQPKRSFIPTIKLTRIKQKAKVSQESEKFYKKLGLVFKDKAFVIQNGGLLLNGKGMINLSDREEKLLKLLVAKSNNVVSFDELSDIIFANEDDFSLWALTKIVQRLRDKLEANGISGSLIQTLRGQGYLLKN